MGGERHPGGVGQPMGSNDGMEDEKVDLDLAQREAEAEAEAAAELAGVAALNKQAGRNNRKYPSIHTLHETQVRPSIDQL